MFSKRSAIEEVALAIQVQLIAANEEATDDQRKIQESGVKWRSTFVLGYVVGLLSICFQNRGIDGNVPGEALQKVARKAHGRDMEIVFAGLTQRMGTEKAQREYEHGQNAALVEDLSSSPSMLKNYLLDRFDFDAEGNIQYKN